MKLKILILLIVVASKAVSQPFVDIVNFNLQTFSASYADSTQWKNKTDNYFLNLFLPKNFKNGNTLLVRLNSEHLSSNISSDSSYSSKLSSISLPIGMKFVSKNKKWETVLIVIPKIASDFKDAIDENDYQYGGIFLEHFVPNDKLKIKAGLYYNREAFGNLFVPLVGVDWKVNDRINLYGILPTNYKVEFNLVKNKLYTGVNLKFFTRSFRLSQAQNYDYVRYDESQVKVFLDYFVVPKVLLFAEVGYSIGRSPWQHKNGTNDNKQPYYVNPIYTPIKNYPIISVGLAYRVRFDLIKSEETKTAMITPAF
jgi:hypothetical protein